MTAGAADEWIRRFAQSSARQRSRLASNAPLRAIQDAALHSGDPFVRRDCMSFLDHYANDESMPVFAAGLLDPVDFVRNIALHSIACDRCKQDDLCAADVIPALVGVVERDRRTELRVKAIGLLALLDESSSRARDAIAYAATDDEQEVVRCAARDALAGRYVAPARRYERRQRRLTR